MVDPFPNFIPTTLFVNLIFNRDNELAPNDSGRAIEALLKCDADKTG